MRALTKERSWSKASRYNFATFIFTRNVIHNYKGFFFLFLTFGGRLYSAKQRANLYRVVMIRQELLHLRIISWRILIILTISVRNYENTILFVRNEFVNVLD
jgi:hypothetical protein